LDRAFAVCSNHFRKTERKAINHIDPMGRTKAIASVVLLSQKGDPKKTRVLRMVQIIVIHTTGKGWREDVHKATKVTGIT